MDKDALPSNMNEDDLPPDLGALAKSEDARQDYAALWRLLHRADEATDASFSVDAAWKDLSDDMDFAASSTGTATAPERPRMQTAADRPARPSAPKPTTPSWTRRLAVAAVLVLGVAVGITAWWSRPISVQTAAGEQTTVTLPDGSTVQLNGATTMAYARGFSSLPWIGAAERRVTLQGEAFFSVTPAQRTFRVETPNAVVDVLGTTFSVRSRTRGEMPATEVVLASGRIRLSASRADTAGVQGSSVVLAEAGQQSRVEGRDASPSPPQAYDLKYATAWRNGGFAVRSAPLPAVLRELELQFGTTIQLSVPVAQTDTMTLHYARDVRLEDVLRDIAVVQGLSYRRINRGYQLLPHDPSR
jgi:transmembrane sensor